MAPFAWICRSVGAQDCGRSFQSGRASAHRGAALRLLRPVAGSPQLDRAPAIGAGRAGASDRRVQLAHHARVRAKRGRRAGRTLPGGQPHPPSAVGRTSGAGRAPRPSVVPRRGSDPASRPSSGELPDTGRGRRTCRSGPRGVPRCRRPGSPVALPWRRSSVSLHAAAPRGAAAAWTARRGRSDARRNAGGRRPSLCHPGGLRPCRHVVYQDDRHRRWSQLGFTLADGSR